MDENMKFKIKPGNGKAGPPATLVILGEEVAENETQTEESGVGVNDDESSPTSAAQG